MATLVLARATLQRSLSLADLEMVAIHLQLASLGVPRATPTRRRLPNQAAFLESSEDKTGTELLSEKPKIEGHMLKN